MQITEYVDQLPAIRQQRIIELDSLVRTLFPEAKQTMRYKMPTYELGDQWFAIASQKNYVSVYTCDASMIEDFKLSHPNIKTGKGCINIRDKDELPIEALGQVVQNALSNAG